MAYAGKNPFKVPRRLNLVGGWNTETLTGAATLTKLSAQNQRLDPGGASRNVTLPAVSSDDDGYWFHFDNAADANESLVVKNAAGTTIITVLQNGHGDVYVDSAGAWTSGGSHVDSVGFASGISVDTISEASAGVGVTIDGLRLQDSTVKPAAGGSAFIDLTACATGEADVILADNLASAFELREAANVYMTVVTTNSAEGFTFSQPITATISKTAASQGVNSDLSINHATAEGIGVDATAVQLTTARSSGNVSAFKGTTTSLAGDSGGVYSTFYAAAPTDGGGSAVHNAVLVGAGYDALIDASAAATGEADIVIGDNLASALQVRQSTNAYLTFVTTNDQERITAGKVVADTITTVDMADAAHALVYGTAGAGETKLLGNVVFCDPNSGQATEDLTLPAVATSTGVAIDIINTGGEGIVVKAVGGATVITLDANQSGRVRCNGSTWYGFIGGIT